MGAGITALRVGQPASLYTISVWETRCVNLISGKVCVSQSVLVSPCKLRLRLAGRFDSRGRCCNQRFAWRLA